MNRVSLNSLSVILFIVVFVSFIGGSASAFLRLQGIDGVIYAKEKGGSETSRTQELEELVEVLGVLESRIGEFEEQMGNIAMQVEKFEERIGELEAELEVWQEKCNDLELEKISLEEKIDELLSQRRPASDEEQTAGSNQGNQNSQSNPWGTAEDKLGGSMPVAYLTFDDGPSKNTIEVLDILKEENIQATFFVTGNHLSGEAGIYSRIVNEGHSLGNHTYTHDFTTIYRSVDNFMGDLLLLEDFLQDETGMTTNIMRFPGGGSSKLARKVAGYDIMDELIPEIIKNGYDYFDWNIDSGDGTGNLTAVEILENVKKGSERVTGDLVILFHDSCSKGTTVEALPLVIAELREKGYVFAPLNPGTVEAKHRKPSA